MSSSLHVRWSCWNPEAKHSCTSWGNWAWTYGVDHDGLEGDWLAGLHSMKEASGRLRTLIRTKNEQKQLDIELWGCLLVMMEKKGLCLDTLQCLTYKSFSGTCALKMIIRLQFKRKCKWCLPKLLHFYIF
jgi:hypothetical protein